MMLQNVKIKNTKVGRYNKKIARKSPKSESVPRDPPSSRPRSLDDAR